MAHSDPAFFDTTHSYVRVLWGLGATWSPPEMFLRWSRAAVQQYLGRLVMVSDDKVSCKKNYKILIREYVFMT